MSQPQKTKSRISAIDRQVAQNLKYLRLHRGLSMGYVADILGVTYQQVQKYEAGRNRIPVAMLHQLKTCYDVPYERFFKDVREDGPPAPARTTDIHTMKLCQQLATIEDPGLQRRARRILHALIED